VTFPKAKTGPGQWRATDATQRDAIAASDGLRIDDECVLDDGRRFKWDGVDWIPVQLMGDAVRERLEPVEYLSAGTHTGGQKTQRASFSIKGSASDGSTVELTRDGAAPAGGGIGASNRILLQDWHSYIIDIFMSGQNDQVGSHTVGAHWKIHAQRKGSAASTIVNILGFSAVVNNGGAGLSADTTNGSIKIEASNGGGGLAEWSGTVVMQETHVEDQSA
jgi:hypothetical protein